MVRIFVLVTLSLSFTRLAYSACSSVDLREDARMPKIRMQGDVSWCYAAVAADLLSFKIGKTISYLDLALMSNPGKKALETKAGGSIDDVLDYAKKSGYCLEEEFPENQGKFHVARVNEEFKKIENLYFSRDRSCNGFDKTSEAFPHETLDGYLKILKKAKAPVQLVQGLESSNCPKRIPTPPHLTWVKNTRKTSGAKILEIVDTQLSQKNPVGIGYRNHLRNLSQVGNPGDYHESSLVGRARNPETHQCEYLLRNQGGSFCINGDGSNFYDSRLKCEDGYIWVPRAVLEKDLNDYSYIVK